MLSQDHICSGAVRVATFVVLLASVTLASVGCREARTEDAPVHLNPNMDDQKYLEAQDPAQIEVDGYTPWADGRAMRGQVEGTVAAPCAEQSQAIALVQAAGGDGERTMLLARVSDASGRCDGLKSDAVYYTGKNPDGSYTTALPEGVEVTRRLVERGKARFGIYCASCHGPSGAGNGTVVARGMTPPPSYHDQTRRSYEIGQIYETITQGYQSMPSLAAQIPVADRWAIATYVRSLQFSHSVAYGNLPEDEQLVMRQKLMGKRNGQRAGQSLSTKFESTWDSLDIVPAPQGGEQ